MRKRPTISLALIVKNERENLPRVLRSIENCFDEIHITDTGSTDGTIEYLQSEEPALITKCPIYLHHFEWCHDFAKARQASFDVLTTDYAMWMDADDELSDKEAFIRFRDSVMATADYWIATYHYAFDEKGNPRCSFIRERVVRLKTGFKWQDFVHEGLVQTEGKAYAIQKVEAWTINHFRTEADTKKDRLRNLKLFEHHSKNLSARMAYYYGKELFEAGEYMEAGVKLLDASTLEELAIHDRLMAIQYAAAAALACGQHMKAIAICNQGLSLMPSRAEYWTMIADAYVQQQRLVDAIPYYAAARNVRPNNIGGTVTVAIEAYEKYPTEQLAAIYVNLGDFEKAQAEIERLKIVNKDMARELAEKMRAGFEMANAAIKPELGEMEATGDIVITCPPGSMGDWDEIALKEKGLGGSETAAVELAEHFRELTGREVIIFNNRKLPHTSKSGVRYLPMIELPNYFRKKRPLCHIAWRHAVRLTSAPSYVWCHDLFTPGAEHTKSYEKILCLSEFHKNYVMTLQNIPEHKIMLMRNGIDPQPFRIKTVEKNPNKIIFPSSPDRGLDRAIEIVKRARRMGFSDLELHVFYGFENMRLMGMHDMADHLEGLIQANPFVHYHGNVTKDVLANHFMESVVWIYPASFIETFCITALESIAAGCYPIVRRFGGVQDTLKEFEQSGMATLLDLNAETDEELDEWAMTLIAALAKKKWEDVQMNAEKYSWRSVAIDWIATLGLMHVEKRDAPKICRPELVKMESAEM